VQSGPEHELALQLDRLERKIDAALELIARLKRENRELAARLVECRQRRAEAAHQLNTVLDKIDALI
jgi:FtsZ-binding cell division protein ZapB